MEAALQAMGGLERLGLEPAHPVSLGQAPPAQGQRPALPLVAKQPPGVLPHLEFRDAGIMGSGLGVGRGDRFHAAGPTNDGPADASATVIQASAGPMGCRDLAAWDT